MTAAIATSARTRPNALTELSSYKSLSAIVRTDQQIGTGVLVDILRGNMSPEVVGKGYQQLKTFAPDVMFPPATGMIIYYKCCNSDTSRLPTTKTII